jgi:succinyl-CoA synthetase alpha subunit
MSIFVNQSSRVLVQGITGREGQFHTAQMLNDGTKIVAGVTPGKGGQKVEGLPVFDTVAEALAHFKKETPREMPDWSIGFVPAPFAKAAALEALTAGLNTVIISEHVPLHDALAIRDEAAARGKIAIGPNCPGIITPGQAKLGIMPASVFRPGAIGVVSRSGTLTYEIVSHLSGAGFGQSTCIGIGGDPINLTSMEEALLAFSKDPFTRAVVLIGEIGGAAEEHVAATVIPKMKKPVVAFLAGRTAPLGKTLGHAGAIIEKGTGTIAGKEAALKKAGVAVAALPAEVAQLIKEALQ